MPDAPDEPENQLAKPVTPASTANARFESGGQSKRARAFCTADLCYSEARDNRPFVLWGPFPTDAEVKHRSMRTVGISAYRDQPMDPVYRYQQDWSEEAAHEWQPTDMFNYIERAARNQRR